MKRFSKKLLSLLLVVLLLSGAVPLSVFAEQVADDGSSPAVSDTEPQLFEEEQPLPESGGEQAVAQEENSGDEIAQDPPTAETTEPSQEVQSQAQPDGMQIAAEENTAVVLNSATPTYLYGVDFEQERINYTTLNVTLSAYEKLLALQAADSVTVTAALSYNGAIAQYAEKTVLLSDLSDGTFTMDLPTYGKFDVSVIFKKGEKTVAKVPAQMVGIIAEEYNVALLNATFPVTQFTLSLWDIKETAAGDPIPTVVGLSRSAAYDWDQLPENVYGLPYIPDGEQGNWSIQKKQDAFSAFVGELYALNPDSKFNLYTVDYSIASVLMLMYKNNIPLENYNVYVLSDGSGSYGIFNKIFNQEQAQSTYDTMAAEWNYVKAEYAKGNFISQKNAFSKYQGSRAVFGLPNYAYVVIREESLARKAAGLSTKVEWWLTRSDTLMCPDAAFQAEARSYVTTKNLASMLSALTEEESVEFKALFHFSEQMFAEAEKQGKKAMMLLGTRVTGEQNFLDYARFVKAYYGDEYVYYYKGHPATPTVSYPVKQEQLETLGILDIDSSIAAELILYFYPDISMSGYSSTTFLSASKDTACGLFAKSKAAAYADVNNAAAYADRVDFFMSLITDFTTETGKLCNPEHVCYLVEFQDDSGHDIAIYDATQQIIYYYNKNADGQYVAAGKTAVKAPIAKAQGGQNEITVSWDPVADAQKYRVSVYQPDTKKYTKLKETTATSYTHTGLGNGETVIYLVQAYDGETWNQAKASNHVSATTTPGAPAVKVKATTNSVTLSWKAVKGATKYKLYALDTDTNQLNSLGYGTETSRTIENLEPGHTYQYLVRSYNSAGLSKYTRRENLISATTLCTAPKLIANGGKRAVTLNWTAVEGATRYRIYAYNAKTKTYTGVANTTKTTYTVSKLADGTAYTYLVRAYNGTAYSPYSVKDHATARTKCAAPKLTATGGKKCVKLQWKAVTGATSYRIYAYDAKTKKYTSIATTKKTAYTVTGLKNGTAYTYLVRANNGATYSPYTTKNHVTVKTLCATPKVTAKAGKNSVTLTWKGVAGAERYRVYVYDTKTKKYTGLGNTKEKTYKITGLKSKTRYVYLVRAYNGTAYSAYSVENTVSVKTK